MIVPDSVDVIEGWRFWRFDATGLKALNGEAWEAGKETVARCVQHVSPYAHYWPTSYFRWVVSANGLTREEAVEHARKWTSAHLPPPPDVELPTGLGYVCESVQDTSRNHDAPQEGCTCGIYAGTDLTVCPGGGEVYGKVKMWGKIIPGKKGWRSQYAYPSELHAPKSLADHPALLAYGVPIIVQNADDPATLAVAKKYRMPWQLKAAIGINLGCGAVNLGLHFLL